MDWGQGAESQAIGTAGYSTPSGPAGRLPSFAGEEVPRHGLSADRRLDAGSALPVYNRNTTYCRIFYDTINALVRCSTDGNAPAARGPGAAWYGSGSGDAEDEMIQNPDEMLAW